MIWDWIINCIIKERLFFYYYFVIKCIPWHSYVFSRIRSIKTVIFDYLFDIWIFLQCNRSRLSWLKERHIIIWGLFGLCQYSTSFIRANKHINIGVYLTNTDNSRCQYYIEASAKLLFFNIELHFFFFFMIVGPQKNFRKI